MTSAGSTRCDASSTTLRKPCTLARTQIALADNFATREEPSQALHYYELGLEGLVDSVGPDHTEVAAAKMGSGIVQSWLGHPEVAERLLREAKSTMVVTLGPEHPDAAAVGFNLGNALLDSGRFEEAASELEWAAGVYEAELGADHPSLAMIFKALGVAQQQLERFPEAEQSFRRVLEVASARHGPRSDRVQTARVRLAETLSALGRHDEAVEQATTSLDILDELDDPSRSQRAEVRFALADALWHADASSRARAVELAEAAAEDFNADLGPQAQETRDVLDWLSSRR